jgi:hypothetical protein
LTYSFGIIYPITIRVYEADDLFHSYCEAYVVRLADTTHPLSPLLLQKEGETGVEFIRKNTLLANLTASFYFPKYLLTDVTQRSVFN